MKSLGDHEISDALSLGLGKLREAIRHSPWLLLGSILSVSVIAPLIAWAESSVQPAFLGLLALATFFCLVWVPLVIVIRSSVAKALQFTHREPNRGGAAADALRSFGALLAIFAASILGLPVLLIGGCYVLVRLSFAVMINLEMGESVTRSLWLSWEQTRGRTWDLILLFWHTGVRIAISMLAVGAAFMVMIFGLRVNALAERLLSVAALFGIIAVFILSMLYLYFVLSVFAKGNTRQLGSTSSPYPDLTRPPVWF